MAVVYRRRRGLGDPIYSNIPGYVSPDAPAGFYDALEEMKRASAAAIAAEKAAGGYQGPGEVYADFSVVLPGGVRRDVSVEEGRAMLDADYRAQARVNAESIAATPGYAGGGEDFEANQIANAWAITRASQGFAPGNLAPPITTPIPDSPLHPVQPPPVLPPITLPGNGEGYHPPPGTIPTYTPPSTTGGGTFNDANGGNAGQPVYGPGGPAGADGAPGGAGYGVSPLVMFGVLGAAAYMLMRKR